MRKYTGEFKGAFGPGFVYLMQSGALYKIGHSIDLNGFGCIPVMWHGYAV